MSVPFVLPAAVAKELRGNVAAGLGGCRSQDILRTAGALDLAHLWDQLQLSLLTSSRTRALCACTCVSITRVVPRTISASRWVVSRSQTAGEQERLMLYYNKCCRAIEVDRSGGSVACLSDRFLGMVQQGEVYQDTMNDTATLAEEFRIIPTPNRCISQRKNA